MTQTHNSHPERDLIEVFAPDGSRHVVSRLNGTDLIQHHNYRMGAGVQPSTDTEGKDA